jgi:PAS domain-containing protein
MAEFLNGLEARYYEQDQNFPAVLMNAPMSIVIMEGRDYRYTFLNELATKRYAPRQLLGKTVKEVFPEIDETYFRLIDGVLDSGISFHAREFPITLDWNLNGSPFAMYFDFVYAPYKDKANQIIGVISMATDVSEMVMARKKVENLQTLLDIVSKVCPISIGVSDKNNQIIYATEAWLNWTGSYLEDNKGDDWLAHIVEDERASFMRDFIAAASAKKHFQRTFKFYAADLSISTAFMQADPWYYPNGEYGGYVSTSVNTDKNASSYY